MGKKGFLLDNGKKAQSSMTLYWKAAQNKQKGEKIKKDEPKQQDMQTRAASNLDKWKLHKQKLINKLYQKPQKKQDQNIQRQTKKQQQQQEKIQKQLLEKELYKNKPISIPGFKNAMHLNSKKQYSTVIPGKQQSNVLELPNSVQSLSQQQIIQILRQKQSKKQLQRLHKQQVQKNLKKRQERDLVMLDQFIQKPPQPQKKQQPKIEPIIQQNVTQSIFKSQILQKIEKGQKINPEKQKPIQKMEEQKIQEKIQQKGEQKPSFNPKFIPRAMWKK